MKHKFVDFLRYIYEREKSVVVAVVVVIVALLIVADPNIFWSINVCIGLLKANVKFLWVVWSGGVCKVSFVSN